MMDCYDGAWAKDCLETCAGVNYIEIDNIYVLISRGEVNFPADTHVHDDLEFMCAQKQDIEHVVCGNAETRIPSGYVMPFLPMQRHGLAAPNMIKQFICITYPFYILKQMEREAGFGPKDWTNAIFLFSAEAGYLINEIYNEYLRGESANKMVLRSLLKLLYVEFTRNAGLDCNNNACERRLKRAAAFFDEQIQFDFDLEKAAAIAGISKYHFARQFKDCYGITPKKYFIMKKIEKAKFFLAQKKSLTEISANLGFSSSSHFSEVFRRETGMSPGEYRKYLIS